MESEILLFEEWNNETVNVKVNTTEVCLDHSHLGLVWKLSREIILPKNFKKSRFDFQLLVNG